MDPFLSWAWVAQQLNQKIHLLVIYFCGKQVPGTQTAPLKYKMVLYGFPSQLSEVVEIPL